MRNVRLAFPAVLLILVAVAVTGLLWGPALGQEKEQEKGKLAGVKLEYKVVDYTRNAKAEEMGTSLNGLGEEGWECVGAVVFGPTGRIRVILKRPKQ